MRVRRRNRDKDLVEGEPSTLGRARHESRRRSGQEQPGDTLGDTPTEPVPQVVPTGPEPEFAQPEEAGEATVKERHSEMVAEVPSPPPGATAGPLAEPLKAQLDRLATQIHGLQEQLSAFIGRRDEAVAERASHHVASIVAAAEESAFQIRAAAKKEAATIRERLLADVQAEVERIRSEAQADAARIRTEAHTHAARAREKAIAEASAQIEVVCAQLSEHLQAGARAAIAGIAGGARPTRPAEAAVQAPVEAAGPARGKLITDEVQDAVQELLGAATALEQSLRNLRAIGDEQQPA